MLSLEDFLGLKVEMATHDNATIPLTVFHRPARPLEEKRFIYRAVGEKSKNTAKTKEANPPVQVQR